MKAYEEANPNLVLKRSKSGKEEKKKGGKTKNEEEKSGILGFLGVGKKNKKWCVISLKLA